ncbi:hypothetical protein FIBSPDRAFT_1054415 [Athelia psychrophila]|uniref:Uncharacterized protein n=1 Tax=Athelia psychrophila TaxID=1759441 RepID=A0A167VCJ3_9AGAM|nr:hypothetical protein FIBSPDRAFT_1054415 [Fibularhizoctonia sp. CBS 109695]
MSLCTHSRCTAPPPRDSQRIVQDGPPAPGELFLVCAAMKHPFLERIKNSGITIRTYLSQATALGSHCTENPWSDGVKPCIVGEGATDEVGAHIYLIRLFTPKTMANLPAIMRHYLIPIHAIHDDQSSDSWVKQYGTYHEHLHTSPSWAEGADHWVLGLACEAPDGAMGRRCLRSSTNSPADGSHYFIDPRTMQKFEDLCTAKDEEWSRKPREEMENGVVQLSQWHTTSTVTQSNQNMKKFPRRGARAKSIAPNLPVVAAEMNNFRPKTGLDKLSDAVSIRSQASSKPSGAIRIRRFLRHVVAGKWL